MALAAVHLGPRYHEFIAAFAAGTPGELLVVTDFDQTLTSFRGSDGGPGLQCHDILLRHLDLDACPLLRDRMAPLIAWHDMPEQQRMQLCEGCEVQRAAQTQWFFDTFAAACVEFGLKEQVRGCVERSNTQVRGGVVCVLDWLAAREVPLFIVSAGLRQVLEALLEAAGISLPAKTSRIIANDVGDPLSCVTSRNKSGALQLVPDLVELCSGRRRALLLGDKPSDCAPAAGLPPGIEVLKIGFMESSEPEPETLEKYLLHFDVVLTGDPSMGFVCELLETMSSSL